MTALLSNCPIRAGHIVWRPFQWDDPPQTNDFQLRPCLVIRVYEEDDKILIWLVPITRSEPLELDARPIEVPYKGRNKTGLLPFDPMWIKPWKLNIVRWEGWEASDFVKRHGKWTREMNAHVRDEVKQKFIKLISEGKLEVTQRP